MVTAGTAGGEPDAGADAGPPPGTASEGCGTAPAPAGTVNLQVGSTQHLYIVGLPSSYDENQPYPLLMAFHGASIGAEFFRSFFNLAPAAGEEAIIVYLEANGGQWDYNRDLPYLDEVVSRLKAEYCIDEDRVFATGHSAGGYFSNAIGVRRTELLRAIAPISGGAQFRQDPDGTIAVWIAHGDADTIVQTSEGRSARDFWLEQNGCNANKSTPVEPSPCVSYADCAAGSPVHYCEFSGGHNIPTWAPQAVWDFFKAL
jgi:poly(3-hydroxybutyrate) depolymerase